MTILVVSFSLVTRGVMDLYSRNSNQRCDKKKLGESWTYTRETLISGMIKKKVAMNRRGSTLRRVLYARCHHRHKGPRTVA